MNGKLIQRMMPSMMVLMFLLLFVWYISYTRSLVSELKKEGVVLTQAFGEYWASAIVAAEGQDEFILARLLDSIEFPVIVMYDDGKPGHWKNIDVAVDATDEKSIEKVKNIAADFAKENNPIVVETSSGEKYAVHYREASALIKLRYVPVILAGILIVFALVAVWVVKYNLKSEKSMIWVGMARESAHQLGTPLSSLYGWIELLRLKGDQPTGADMSRVNSSGEILEISKAMQEDLARLSKVANRFELIGIKPKLTEIDLSLLLRDLNRYFEARLPKLGKRIKLELDVPASLVVIGNRELLEWAVENLIKNSLDALGGMDGKISITARRVDEQNEAHMTVVDTGPGIPKEFRRRIFETGVTTKERGWGVGLALSKRIVEDYHHGGLTLVSTSAKNGTVFLFTLPLAVQKQCDTKKKKALRTGPK